MNCGVSRLVEVFVRRDPELLSLDRWTVLNSSRRSSLSLHKESDGSYSG